MQALDIESTYYGCHVVTGTVRENFLTIIPDSVAEKYILDASLNSTLIWKL
jgi:hypothetical protein